MAQPEAVEKRKWSSTAILVVILSLLAGWLALRWSELGFRWPEFRSALAQLRWGWAGLAAVLGLLTYVGRALRWCVMLRPVTSHPRFWNVLKATAIGFAAVVLFSRPGELVRPYLIARSERVPFSSQMAAWLLERILDLLTILLVFGLALASVDKAGAGPRLGWVLQVGGGFVGVVCTISIGTLFFLRQYSEPALRRLTEALSFLPPGLQKKAVALLSAFVDGLRAVRSFASLALLIGYSVLEWVLIAICYICLFQAFPATSGFGVSDVVVFMGFVSFGSIVQIPGVGGGTQLVTIVVLTELFHLSLELATSMAFLTWIITFVVIIPPGVVLALHEGLNWRRLRHLDVEKDL